MRKYQLLIKGVDCGHCASKIEEKVQKLNGIYDASYQFMTEKLTFHCEETEEHHLIHEIEKIVHLIEPDAVIESLNGPHKHEHHHKHDEHCDCGHEHHHKHEEHCDCGHEHHHKHEEHCDCGHEHHHKHEERHVPNLHQKYQYVLSGLDCANCAAKVERYLNHQSELSDVQILFMQQTLKLNSTLPESEVKEYVQKKIDEVEHGVMVEDVKFVKKTDQQGKKIDHELLRIVIASGLLILGFIFHDLFVLSLILFASCYLLVGTEILVRALRNILKGQVFDENFLMAIATIGAIVVSEYAEACAVMVFYQIGEYFQNKAVEKSRRSISELMDIRPDEAHVERSGKIVTVAPDEVEIGEILVVRAGEKVPLDGIIIEGKSSLDTRALTGESKVQTVEENDEVLSGVINVEGVIRVKTTKYYSDSTVAKILDLVENAGSRKAPAEAFITKFAKVYTPFVCILALAIAVLPVLLIKDAYWMDYLYRACTFLVISCPCALVVSVPLSYFAGIGGLSAKGILVKGSSYLDVLNHVDTYVFDKTGTLTEGSFTLSEVISQDKEYCLKIAAAAEKHSNHPIALSIVKSYDGEMLEAEDVHEIAGRGIACKISGKQVFAGNERLMEMHNIQTASIEKTGTVIHVAEGGIYLGALLIQDQIRLETKELVKELKALGKHVVMLTGDQKRIADEVASELGISEVHAELLPADKVSVVEKLIHSGRKPAFAGDGINDAPVLAMSSVGFAMGGIGSDAAIEAADIVIMNDNPMNILTALKSAEKTRKIVMENIYGALFVKFVILLLGALGKAGMWSAVFADVGVAVIAIMNAIRAMKVE
ncbi:MAG: cadmium-translocating P-type ATPase [Erysipelotrichaceae bacterium]|nr:cadmium-translocating P-type ATPase [Erysipelotrichaceae bacterium]